MAIIITGGAGFIGSHVVRTLVRKYPTVNFINVDALTYAGNLANLQDVQDAANYHFVKGDIVDRAFVEGLFREHAIEGVIHLAAESHVDRSISGPDAFIQTNIVGTHTMLHAAYHAWKDDMSGKRFYHVSTDEVFGSLGSSGLFDEHTAYDPRSPYSASKAASDHLVRAYYHTYGLPVVISNCSNNFGSHHFPEKLIPLLILNIRDSKELPVYGQGENIRDWLWVEDHARAIDLIYHRGQLGETYCIGGMNEWKNIDLVRLICRMMDKKLNRATGSSEQLIRFVKDRPGHDARYAIDPGKLRNELGWEPTQPFEQILEKTIDWYLENEAWLNQVTSGDYRHYYEQQYKS